MSGGVPVVDISGDPVAVGAELDEIEEKLSAARPAADYPYGYIPMAGEALSRSGAPGQSMAGTAPSDLKEVFSTGPHLMGKFRCSAGL